MKIEELSIGDWVFHLAEMQAGRISHIHRIGGIYSIGLDCADCVAVCGINDIAPIAITPEILEKNGFVDVGGVFNYDTVDLFCEDGKLYFAREAGYDKLLQVQHVHQLQHALRLAGINKEIEV